jgi:transketolase
MERKEGFDMDGIGEDLSFFLKRILRLSPSCWFSSIRTCNFPFDQSKITRSPNYIRRFTEASTVSGCLLGQGLSYDWCGNKQKKLNGDNHIIYTLHGDGSELQEGQTRSQCMLLQKWYPIATSI